MTVEETISTAINQFVAGCVAEQEAEKNIIPFPRPHPPRFLREDARAQAGIQKNGERLSYSERRPIVDDVS